DTFIELKSVRRDQGNVFWVRSFSNIPKQSQRVVVAASADYGRRPESGPDLDSGEDPDRLLFTLRYRADLVGLELGGLEPSCFLIVEAAAAAAGFFPPAINGIPADAVDTRNCRLVQTLDTESRNLIKGVATMLKSIVGSPSIGRERFLAGLASISTALSPTRLVE